MKKYKSTSKIIHDSTVLTRKQISPAYINYSIKKYMQHCGCFEALIFLMIFVLTFNVNWFWMSHCVSNRTNIESNISNIFIELSISIFLNLAFSWTSSHFNLSPKMLYRTILTATDFAVIIAVIDIVDIVAFVIIRHMILDHFFVEKTVVTIEKNGTTVGYCVFSIHTSHSEFVCHCKKNYLQ